MTSGSDDGSKERTRRSKVARVIKDYDLTGMDEELVALWTGDSDERHSLRDLADNINKLILEVAMKEEGMNPLEGEVENMYRLLTDEKVSSGTQIEAETTLERNGIDVDKLTRDFVSHQAVHTYLTKYRGIDGPTNTEAQDQIEKTATTVQRLQNRLNAVAEKSLQSLRNTGRLPLGDFSVFVDVRVFCENCGTQAELSKLLRTGGCECNE